MSSWPVKFWVMLCSLQQQSVPFPSNNIHLQGEILHRGRFSLLVRMAGHSVKLWPVVVSRVWLQWRLWPISLYCSDVKQSHGRVKPWNVVREWIWLIWSHSFPQWTLPDSQFFKMRCLQAVGEHCKIGSVQRFTVFDHSEAWQFVRVDIWNPNITRTVFGAGAFSW